MNSPFRHCVLVATGIKGKAVQASSLCTTFAVLSLVAVGGCSHQSATSEPPRSSPAIQTPNDSAAAPESGQEQFQTPQDAAAALKKAVDAGDRRQLIQIFGNEGRQLILTGDRVQEDNDMQAFASRMSENARVELPSTDKAVLYIGAHNWPFPIPIVKSGDKWFFDTVAGKDELLNRRIGENELSAIAVCRAYVAAQKEYGSKPREGDTAQFAMHFTSSAGKKDGLYWPVGPGEPLSPMGPLVAAAHEEGYGQNPPTGKPQPYHGYYFHILTAQGDAATGGKMSYLVDGHLTKGFAFIAWPDKWGASGIMTFTVNQDGKVYQKNLGESTHELAKTITEYNPDSTWELVKD